MTTNRKVIQRSDQVVLQSDVTNKNHISTTRVTIATKRYRHVSLRAPTLKITWFYDLMVLRDHMTS